MSECKCKVCREHAAALSPYIVTAGHLQVRRGQPGYVVIETKDHSEIRLALAGAPRT